MIFLLFFKKKTIWTHSLTKINTILSLIEKYMIIQYSLLTPKNISQKNIHIDNIKATFINVEENFYNVILEINSNKFLINMQTLADNIEQFEIIAIKWFIELSNKIINIVKKLVEHLRYRLE